MQRSKAPEQNTRQGQERNGGSKSGFCHKCACVCVLEGFPRGLRGSWLSTARMGARADRGPLIPLPQVRGFGGTTAL
ncbi:hypothetical protein BD289DRAFT_439417 [Coniella lustricola]|uniref:Uncharacterized protein n=1 Tax=Coniella lustricola TaxID=2025994 RepID=A0A2T3A1P7_9PEZI|nr:hypothetical protein BD289DRAFT_439417 [Coniella lustricola]